jgi:hypothetical protein
MDLQQRLRELGLERGRVLNACVVDLDRRDEIERTYARLVIRIAQDRLVKTR